MNKLYIYNCHNGDFVFNINNYLLCEIEDNTQALETALFLKCNFVRLINDFDSIWIKEGSILESEPDWYQPDTIKNI